MEPDRLCPCLYQVRTFSNRPQKKGGRVLGEDELVRLAQTGDEEALAELYRHHEPQAFKTAYLMLGSRHLAEDVVQETFIRVIRKIATLREPTRFKPWLLQTLTNAARSTYRKHLWRQWLPLDLYRHDKPDRSSPSAQERLETAEELGELRDAIRQLKPEHRMPIVLHYYNGLSEEAVAEILECPIGTVKSRMHRARQQLNRLILGGPDNLDKGSATKPLV